uniref:Reverse transcriptase domain-containing protein n=1 Tax=Tanacetum cinerariifolium TaxID=118510 RepID=A0A6L2KGS7_TANCI|nr:hypothetical protein [Tanacetum cinerariifolium]
MPRSIYEYLKLANLEGATMSVEMDDMTQQKTLGTVKNVMVKIDKFEFPCDFVVTDMPENLGEMIILGRPFLKTIHAYMDVFQEEISLEIGEDRINFDINRNPRQSNITIKKIYMRFLENANRECLDSGYVFVIMKGHTNIYDSDWEIMFNEWILDSFDVEEEYAKEIGNPYSQRFDEYKQVFASEVENLSNEYTLRIRKKGNEEEEPWRSGDEKTNYEPPFVNVKTFEVKKYSFKRGQSFICITKQDDDALPLGRVNGARFKAMIRKELKDKGIPYDET